MYTQFFRLNQAPFSIAPDPRYLYMSERHREALAHLLYGVNSGGGFVLLTGEIGAGKTTVCRCFLEQIPANCNVAYIFNPKLTVNELLKSICAEFSIRFGHDAGHAATAKDYVDVLNEYLLATHAEGQNNVLIIDEAQNLSAEVLEQLRLLTNLETNERKLLQIILIGQPELRDMLARPELEQLAQRVIARYHLGSLSMQETARYILHRLTIASLTASTLFQPAVMQQIHRVTHGVPRRINLLCDRALLGAYAENKCEVDRGIVKKAASEIFDEERVLTAHENRSWRYALLGLAAGAAIAGVALWTTSNDLLMKSVFASRPATTASVNSSLKIATVTPKDEASNSTASAQKSSSSESTTNRGPGSASTSLSGVAPATLQTGTMPPVATLGQSELDRVVGSSARDRNLAYQQLAQFWNVTLPDGEPCQAALKKDLRCYKSGSGLAEIRQLDRPALLALHDDANKTYYALVTGLSNANATLRIGSTTQTVSMVALGRHVRGDFVTFWRAPQGYRDHIGNGDHGAEVDWLAAQLARLNGMKDPIPNQPFDQPMARLVREFQAAQGLRIDGVVGPQTFMHFNRAAGIDEPHLQSALAVAIAGPGK